MVKQQASLTAMTIEINCESLDFLCDVIHRFGNLVSADHHGLLLNLLFQKLSSSEDDKDISWKVRRAAAKCLSAIIVSRPEMLSKLYREAFPKLMERFNEREENVKMDVFNTFIELLLQTGTVTKGQIEQSFFAAFIHSANTSFDALLESLLSSAKPSPLAGGLAKQALYSLAQCVALLCLAAGDQKCGSTVEMLTKILKDDCSTNSAKLHLALLCLGEIGRRKDLSSHVGIENMVMESFQSPFEEIKSAACYALGNLAVGSLSKYLPFILDQIHYQQKPQHLLLSLKEVIARQSVDKAGWSEFQCSAQSNLERGKGALQSNNEHYTERLLACQEKGLQGLVHVFVERLIELDKQSAAVSDTCYKLVKEEKDFTPDPAQLHERLVSVKSGMSALQLDNEELESKSVELQKFQEQHADEIQLAEERIENMEDVAHALILKKTELEILLTYMEERIKQFSESELAECKKEKLLPNISTLESESQDILDKLQEKQPGKAEETEGLQVDELCGNLEEKEQLNQMFGCLPRGTVLVGSVHDDDRVQDGPMLLSCETRAIVRFQRPNVCMIETVAVSEPAPGEENLVQETVHDKSIVEVDYVVAYAGSIPTNIAMLKSLENRAKVRRSHGVKADVDFLSYCLCEIMNNTAELLGVKNVGPPAFILIAVDKCNQLQMRCFHFPPKSQISEFVDIETIPPESQISEDIETIPPKSQISEDIETISPKSQISEDIETIPPMSQISEFFDIETIVVAGADETSRGFGFQYLESKYEEEESYEEEEEEDSYSKMIGVHTKTIDAVAALNRGVGGEHKLVTAWINSEGEFETTVQVFPLEQGWYRRDASFFDKFEF